MTDPNTPARARRRTPSVAHRRPAPPPPVRSVIETELQVECGAHTAPVRQIAVTADGRRIVSVGGRTIRIWDAQTLKHLRLILGHIPVRQASGRSDLEGYGSLASVALTPDGRWIVALRRMPTTARPGQTEVQVFELETGNLRSRFLDPNELVSADVSPDGRTLAMVGRVRGWAARLRLYALKDVLAAGFASAPRPVCTRGLQRTGAAGAELPAVRFLPLPADAGSAPCLVVTTCSAQGADTPGEGRVHWARFSRRLGLQLLRSEPTASPILAAILAVHREGVVVAARDGIGGPDGHGRLFWHPREGGAGWDLQVDTVPATLALSPDGSRLLVGLSAPRAARVADKPVPVLVYRMSPELAQPLCTYYGHDFSVSGLASLGEAVVISSGGDQNALHRWDASRRHGRRLDTVRHRGQRIFAAEARDNAEVWFSTVAPGARPHNHPLLQNAFDLVARRLSAIVRDEVPAGRQRRWRRIPDLFGDAVIPLLPAGRRSDASAVATPGLSLYIGADDEWVLWSPSGYYDASPGGALAIGYQVNLGVDREALFLRSDRFKAFYRPTIIQEIVRYGSEERARQAGCRIEPLDVTGMLPPQLAWSSQGQVIGDGEVTLCFETTTLLDDQPVTRLIVLRNDHVVWSDARPRAGRHRRYRANVPLRPGLNRYSVFAESAHAKADPLLVELQGPAADWGAQAYGGDGPGQLFLLSVGVSDFAVADTPAAAGIRRLRNAHRDATAVYNLLGKSIRSAEVDDHQPLRNDAFGSVDARLLVNAQATKAAIVDALRSIAARVRERGRSDGAGRDVLLVFLSGHGFRYQGESDLFFMNHDLLPSDADATGVSMRELGEWLGDVCAEVVLVVDACHAGLAGSNIVGGLDPAELAQRVHAVTERGMYVLAAARAEELGWEDRVEGLSVFTEALLETLQSDRYLVSDGPDSGTRSIGMMGLMDGLQQTVPRVSARAGRQAQTPVCRTFGNLLPLTIYREDSSASPRG